MVLFESLGSLVAVGDALGMLHGAAKFKAKDQGLNLTFMETAIIFAPQGSTIEALHIWSEENALADALSRQRQGDILPEAFTEVTRSRAHEGPWRILGVMRTPPRRARAARSAGVGRVAKKVAAWIYARPGW